MKRAVFVHDHRFIRSRLCSAVYSNPLSYQALSRYLRFVDNLSVCGRFRWASDESNIEALASGPGLKFEFFDSLSGMRRFFSNYRSTKKRMEGVIEDSDFIVARLPSELGLQAAKIAIKQEKPLLIELVANPMSAMRNFGGFLPKVYSPIFHLRHRSVIFRASHVIYVTDRVLQKLYPTKGLHISASNVVILPQPSDLLERRLSKIGQRKQNVKLGLIANLDSPFKGVETAIRCLVGLKLACSMYSWQLEVLGGGSSEKYLQLAKGLNCEAEVKFVGQMPSGEPILKWLDDIDIYLQPSVQEGLPRALIEAMSRGLPCIASRVDGIPELLMDQCLHRPRDYSAMASLIGEMVQTPKFMLEQAAVNFKRSSDFHLSVIEARRDRFLQNFFQS